MPRNNRNPQSKKPTAVVKTYNIRESTQRLENVGFHPKVTKQTPKEYIASWLAMRKRMMTKPAPEPGYFGPLGFSKQPSTMASLILHPDHYGRETRHCSLKALGQAEGCPLSNLLVLEGMATSITECVFANGLRSAQNLALTSSSVWAHLTANVSIWNFVIGEFEGRSASGVFLAVVPQYTVGDIRSLCDEDPLGWVDGDPAERVWWKQIQEDEDDLFARIKNGLDALQSQNRTEKRESARELGKPTMILLKEFLATDDLWLHRQLDMIDPAQDGQKLQLCRLTECYKLNDMIRRLMSQHHFVKILHFDRIPLMDRRLLAIILRGCPNVTMLGIYNCPLIHFGDIICILDLIHEVNRERAASGYPKVKSFDFFPSFEKGMSCEGPGAAVYGLWWNPMELETSQRGLYAIILKAFMKAQAMDISLLFDKDASLQDWLFKVPNLPFGVPIFFDALYRLLAASKRGQKGDEARKQAIWDLRKAVRLGIDDQNWRRGEPWRYCDHMEDRFFCAACGYEMIDEFFRTWLMKFRGMESMRRCAGCELQQALDEQNVQHQLYDQRLMLNNLFPGWDGKVFNPDAPLSKDGYSIIQLRTVETVPASPSVIVQPDVDGEMGAVTTVNNYVRNHKINDDSLMGLPTLAELAGIPYYQHWENLAAGCLKLSAFRCVARMIVDQRTSDIDPVLEQRFRKRIGSLMPNGKPDNFNEHQVQRTSRTEQSYSYDSALVAFGILVKKGYLPGELEDLLGPETMEVYDRLYDDAFW